MDPSSGRMHSLEAAAARAGAAMGVGGLAAAVKGKEGWAMEAAGTAGAGWVGEETAWVGGGDMVGGGDGLGDGGGGGGRGTDACATEAMMAAPVALSPLE